MSHRLDPLLTPRSIAVVGASERAGSVGSGMVEGLQACAFPGPIHAINPKYDSIHGLPCHASLRDLPEAVDLAIIGVNSAHIETQMQDAIARGIKAAVIFDTCYVDNDPERTLLARLKAMAAEAGMPVCGGNGMGFLNMAQRISATTYNAAGKMAHGGNVTFITHSGTVFSEIGLNDWRYRCNLVVSCGQEIGATMAEYIDYALEMPSTRVIALFMEQARDPQGMEAALAKAYSRGVPVVAMKVGRTPAAAAFARVHSNADTGNDADYAAMFARHGVLRVASMEEMGNLLTLLASERPIAAGGLGVVLDSGGEREMLVDLAHDAGIAFAEIGEKTRERFAARLHHALEPVNPLDAWGTASNFEDDFQEFFSALADDPAVAIAMFCGDFTWSPTTEGGYSKALVGAQAGTRKPLAALINTPMSGLMTAGKALSERGIVVLCGTASSLRALKLAFGWRDRPASGA